MLSLPDVTVVVIDCAAHDLTHMALTDTLEHIDPGDVLIFSNRSLSRNFSFVPCSNSSPADAFNLLWYVVPQHLRTSHMLHIEWDGWVLDSKIWNPKWLEVDYIGAPWPWHDERRVGNGGFSLRSRDFMRYLARNPGKFPLRHPEDDLLCRTYRPILEGVLGFQWAEESEAERFSLEHGPLRPSFGFHDMRNWPRVLSRDAFQSRLRVAPEYVREKPGWNDLLAVGVEDAA